MRNVLAVAQALAVVAQVAAAADFYALPDGAGKRDGTSWADACDRTQLGALFNERLQPGDRLLLGGGTYPEAQLTISTGGTADQPKTLIGVDRGDGPAVLLGAWSIDAPTHGATALRLGPGAAHVVVADLQIRGYATVVQASAVEEGAGRSHLAFRNVDAEQFRYGFYLADCDDVELTDCDLRRYSKHGFRLEAGCDRVAFRRCTADCSTGDVEWEKKTELLPFGFNVNSGGAPNTSIRFEDCLAANNLMPLQKNKYKNGDGYVVEGNARDVSFARCRAIRNQDGGYDLKVPEVKLVDCLAIGNSKGFRIWTTATLDNCLAGWGSTGLWANGGPVAVRRSTFHELKAAVMTDDRAHDPVTLADCILSNVGEPHRKTARGKAAFEASILADRAQPELDPQFTSPVDAAWNGLGDAMNSGAFPDKGYRRPRRRRVHRLNATKVHGG